MCFNILFFGIFLERKVRLGCVMDLGGFWDATGDLKRKRCKHEKPMFSLSKSYVFKVSGLPFRHGHLEKMDYGSRACFEMNCCEELVSFFRAFLGLNS